MSASARLLRSMFVPLSLMLVAACGESGPSSRAVTAQGAESYCHDGCEFLVGCEGGSVSDCTARCVAEVQGWMREDVLAAITECKVGLSCGESDAVCLATCEPTAAHERYESTCRASAFTCGLPVDQADQQCAVAAAAQGDAGFVCMVAPEIVDRLTACYLLACDAVDQCVFEVYEDAGVAG